MSNDAHSVPDMSTPGALHRFDSEPGRIMSKLMMFSRRELGL